VELNTSIEREKLLEFIRPGWSKFGWTLCVHTLEVSTIPLHPRNKVVGWGVEDYPRHRALQQLPTTN
jgi:hypothetical protein